MSAAPDVSEDDLHAFVDDALPEARRRTVEASIAADPSAARLVAALRAQRAGLRAALGPIAAEPVPDRLDVGRLLAARDGRPRSLPPAHRWEWRTRWRAVAAAVVLLLVGGVGGFLLRGAGEPTQRGLAALGAEASDAYAAFASDRAHPVAFRGNDNAEVLRWIGEHLHRPVAAPDLTVAGYRLMGGRLVETPFGPAAMFMYDDDHGIRIVVMTRPMQDKTPAPMTPDDRGDTKGYLWAHRGMGFCVVGPDAADKLRNLADEVRRQTSQDA